MRVHGLIVTVLLFNYVHCYFIKDGYSLELYNTSDVSFKVKPINDGPLPLYYDWREEGFVSPVKDQGACGACWAFSAVANIESHIKIYLDKEVTLSEQFLIDCEVGRVGCQSTTVLKVFGEIVSIFGGVLQERDYNSYSGRPETCRWQGKPQPVPVVGFRRVQPDERVMTEYLFKYGPLSAAINSASMEKYKGNFIDEPSDADCPASNLNHAVLIVGYNTFIDKTTGKQTPYWIIKNSWGKSWGDNGFYYLVRGRNACGIASDISFSIVN
ncbi:cysteine proteinase 15A-like [Zerene cesonia]|uniref:cysteine proteinase 15A-like n=1 Tax=Zerene cesonia TaxID=33412 RepID=UPI0018E5A54B|nr:cysteine proteinase 15A-like [Zerene cesonia]